MKTSLTLLLLTATVAYASGIWKREAAAEPEADPAAEAEADADADLAVFRVWPNSIRRNKKGATHYRFRHNKFKNRGKRATQESDFLIGNPVIVDDHRFDDNDTDATVEPEIDLQSELNQKLFHFNFVKYTKRSADEDAGSDGASNVEGLSNTPFYYNFLEYSKRSVDYDDDDVEQYNFKNEHEGSVPSDPISSNFSSFTKRSIDGDRSDGRANDLQRHSGSKNGKSSRNTYLKFSKRSADAVTVNEIDEQDDVIVNLEDEIKDKLFHQNFLQFTKRSAESNLAERIYDDSSNLESELNHNLFHYNFLLFSKRSADVNEETGLHVDGTVEYNTESSIYPQHHESPDVTYDKEQTSDDRSIKSNPHSFIFPEIEKRSANVDEETGLHVDSIDEFNSDSNVNLQYYEGLNVTSTYHDEESNEDHSVDDEGGVDIITVPQIAKRSTDVDEETGLPVDGIVEYNSDTNINPQYYEGIDVTSTYHDEESSEDHSVDDDSSVEYNPDSISVPQIAKRSTDVDEETGLPVDSIVEYNSDSNVSPQYYEGIDVTSTYHDEDSSVEHIPDSITVPQIAKRSADSVENKDNLDNSQSANLFHYNFLHFAKRSASDSKAFRDGDRPNYLYHDRTRRSAGSVLFSQDHTNPEPNKSGGKKPTYYIYHNIFPFGYGANLQQ